MTEPLRGCHGKLLWIDLAAKRSVWEERPEEFFRQYIGGSLLGARLLLERTPPGIEPLGPDNLLIFASSVCAGHPAPGLARFTAVAKSPLTGGIGESRCEGPWGSALKSCGADAIVITGAAATPVSVLIDNGVVSFHEASDLWGTTVGECCDALEKTWGPTIHVAAIGPAGERRIRFASIVTDRSYQVARMGLGAVMGAKRLKALALKGGVPPPVADPAFLSELGRTFAERIPGNPLSLWQRDPPGFSCWVYLHGVDAALCVNNYSLPGLDGTERFKTEEFLRRYRGEGNCPGCPNRCIKILHPLNGGNLDPRASGIHQEAPGALGPNLGITELDWILRMNNRLNQVGLDPVSTGYTLSFAMELFSRGILDPRHPQAAAFGDAASAERLLDDILLRRGLGDTLAEGTKRAAFALGPDAQPLAMQVKGLEMVCFEPRSQTNLALGYALAPLGPRYDICEHDWDFDTRVGWEHTLRLSRALGIRRRIPMNHLGPDKVMFFKALSSLWSAADALGLCLFAVAPTRILSLPEMAKTVAAVTGWETSDYELMRIGERRNHLLRWYNLREGLTAADDILPDRFFTEPIAFGARKGDVLDRAAFLAAIRTYYEMMGWDEAGRPLPATLYDHQLEWVLQGKGNS